MNRKILIAGALVSAMAIPVLAKPSPELNERKFESFVKTAVRDATTLSFTGPERSLEHNRDLFVSNAAWDAYAVRMKRTPLFGEVASHLLLSEGQSIFLSSSQKTERHEITVNGQVNIQKIGSQETTFTPYTYTVVVDTRDPEALRLKDFSLRPKKN